MPSEQPSPSEQQKYAPELSQVLKPPPSESDRTSVPYTLTLLFGGDIMCHTQNFMTSDFSVIWKEVVPFIRSADFSFANIESPVDDLLPYETYPSFNMRSAYPEAAIRAGFNVFSLANNHSNDQGVQGMMQTLVWAEKTSDNYENSGRKVYFSGVHDEKNNAGDYAVILKDGWTIVFYAVTEILNTRTGAEYINYVPPDQKSRRMFEAKIKEIRRQNPCDLFILSIHAAVPEYERGISEQRRQYYYSLLDSGADIIWANHPHVVQEREIVGRKESENFSKVIMYANGNTISGQRRNPSFNNPSAAREYTGDGLLYKVTYIKTEISAPAVLEETESKYITTYIDPSSGFIVKFLNNDFIKFLKESGLGKWASYLFERKKIMEKIKETKTWL